MEQQGGPQSCITSHTAVSEYGAWGTEELIIRFKVVCGFDGTEAAAINGSSAHGASQQTLGSFWFDSLAGIESCFDVIVDDDMTRLSSSASDSCPTKLVICSQRTSTMGSQISVDRLIASSATMISHGEVGR